MSEFTARDALPFNKLMEKLGTVAPVSNIEGALRDVIEARSPVPQHVALFFYAMSRQESGREALEWLADLLVRNNAFPGKSIEERAMNDVRREHAMAVMAAIGKAIEAGKEFHENRTEKDNAKPAEQL